MKPKTRPQFLSLIAWSACALTFGTTQSTLAATGTWTGSPAAIWDTSATNWTGVTDPAWDGSNGPLNVALFNSASATPAVSGTVFANGITFSDNATVSGGIITLEGTMPTITTTADAAIGSTLAGSVGLTKAGAGVLVLSAENTLTGGIILDGGTLRYTTSQTNSPGALIFGASNGSVNTSALDLNTTPSDLSASGLTVRTASATANAITIGAAKALTVSGAVSIGATTGTTNLTLTGATGTFAINNGGGATNANFYIGGGGTATGTVDMSGLGIFTANLGTGTFAIGNGSTTNTGTIPFTAILAASNSLTATKVSVGAGFGNPTNVSAYTLRLGSGTNTINTSDLYVGTFNNQGRGNGNTALNFNTTTGTLTLRGLSGGSTRANVHIGENQGGSTGNASGGKFDLGGSASTSLSGGNSDLLIDALTISRRTAGSNDTSSMTFRGGVLDVNTLTVGNSTGNNNATGTLSLNGGTVVFNTAITLGLNTSASGTGTGTATMNVAGANVTATPGIVMGNRTTTAITGTVVSNVNISAGTVTLGADITKIGTTTSTVTVSGGTLNMAGNEIGTLADTISVVPNSGTIRNLATLNGTGTLVKANAGTATLLMDAISFAGPVQVNAGTLILKADGFAANLPYQGLVTSGGGTGITLETTTAGSSLFLEEARSSYAGGSNPTLTFTGPGNISIGTTGVTAPSKQLIGIFNHAGTVTLNGPWAYAGVGTSSQINSGTVIFKNNNLSGLKLANIGGGASAPVIDNQSGANITNLSAGISNVGTTTLNGNFTFGSAATNGTLTLGSGITSYTLGTIEDTTRTITVAGLATNQLIISKPIADGTNITTPTINLTKEGIGILTLTDTSSYTGATTVNTGTLTLTGSLTTSSVEVKNNATLSGNGDISGSLTIRSGARHVLAVAANTAAQLTRDITGTLTLDSGNILDLTAAVPPAGGIYVLATATGGIIGTPTVINQTGVAGVVSVDTVNSPNRLLLTVTPAAGGFASWIALFPAVGGQNQPGDDPDNDGVKNLLEFILNGTPTVSDSSILPELVVTATDFEFTYQRRDDSLSPETTQTFQWGATLATWSGSALVPATSGPVGVVTITVSAGIPDNAVTDTVKVSIPITESGGTGKLFGRLKVEQ